MLSKPFQEDIPLQMFVYPAVESAALPEVFMKFGLPPAQTFALPPEQIDANRETWIEQWTQLVLK